MGMFIRDSESPEHLLRQAARLGLERIEAQPRRNWPREVRFPLMLIFARGDRKGEGKALAEQLISSASYYNAESGDAFDFMYAGWNTNRTTGELAFDLDSFMDFKRFLERVSTWRYSGETDMVILNLCVEPKKGLAYLETEEVIVLAVERMLRKKLVESIDGYMQQIFTFAHLISEDTSSSGQTPTWRLSDKLGLQRARDSLWRALVDWAAGRFKTDVEFLENVVVSDLTRAGGTPELQVKLRAEAA